MAQTQPQRRADYWRMAWEKRPPSQFFTPYRAIPSVVAAACAFLVKYHKDRCAFPLDMWIAIGIIVGVYLVLYAIESLWSFAVISPVNLHTEQTKTISDLTEQNSKLRELACPKVTPDEERRRQIVLEKINRLNRTEKQMLRYIMDCQPINPIALAVEKRFNPPDVQKALASGSLFLTHLIARIGDDWSIKSEFRSALDFVLRSEDL